MIEDIEGSSKVYFDKLKSRDYKCPCGKAYLSYAALFTHIKQKHEGKVLIVLFSPLEKLLNPEVSIRREADPHRKVKLIQI